MGRGPGRAPAGEGLRLPARGAAPAGTIRSAPLLGARWTPPGTQPASVRVRHHVVVGPACPSQKHVLTAATHACRTHSRTPGRSAGAGRTAAVGPWIRGTHQHLQLPGVSAASSAPRAPAAGSVRPQGLGAASGVARGRLRAGGGHPEVDLLSEEDGSGPRVVLCSPQPYAVLVTSILVTRGSSLKMRLSPSRPQALPAAWAPSQGHPRAESTLRAGSSSTAPGHPVGSCPAVLSAMRQPGEEAPRVSPTHFTALCSVPSRTWARALVPGEERGPGCGPGSEQQPPPSPDWWGGGAVCWQSGLGEAGVRCGQGRALPSAVCACVYTYLWLLFGFVFVLL